MEPFPKSVQPTFCLVFTAFPGVLCLLISLCYLCLAVPLSPRWLAVVTRMGTLSETGFAFRYASSDRQVFLRVGESPLPAMVAGDENPSILSIRPGLGLSLFL